MVLSVLNAMKGLGVVIYIVLFITKVKGGLELS